MARLPTRTISLQSAVVVAFVLMLVDEGATADLARGRSIALRWCSQCHIVGPGQAHGSDSVPTFAEISESRHFQKELLPSFLAAPEHSRMPNLSLTQTEIADLVAYIKAQHP
ncbi:c-type cytochrome [Rhizobium leucaenae]|uniref:c-type cytochrome n=1 Tax=Rhizobium leucaenae TaxID=29450 RepID=UPI0007EE2F93|nr:cytochrome c [Rhizobium leucaenae]MBB6303731.1 mono/diheme cytochrome c family protein [Rhizobium leucaenae]